MAAVHPTINIAIVDDHNLFRKGLIKLINLGDVDHKYAILFEADNGCEMQEKLAAKLAPDIILMDIHMPDMDGYTAVSWLRNYHPNIKILIISMFETEETVIRMTQLKVNGYLSKDIEVEDMHLALESIISKGYYFSDSVSTIMAQSIINGGDAKPAPASINEVERTLLKLACTDLTYQQIAKQMNLSFRAIDGYRENLFKKLKVQSRQGLVVQALKRGFVQLDEI